MLKKLWSDEAGVIAVEYLFLVTIVGLGLVIGFSNLEVAINAEYTELGNAILALSQGYAIANQSGCKSYKQGSAALDTPTLLSFTHGTVTAPAVVPSNIDVAACAGTGP